MQENGSASRHTTIIIICSKKFSTTSIQFSNGLEQDIYLVSNFRLLRHYVENLLDRLLSASDYDYDKLSIILVNEDISILLSAIELLHCKQMPASRNLTKERSVLMYKRSLTKSYGTKDLDFEVTLPAGCVDCPLGFELCILQNCEGYTNLDQLSESHVWTQQMLRFMAMKHGASFGAISGFTDKLSNSSVQFNFVEMIQSEVNFNSARHLVFSTGGAPTADNLIINQFVPSGEDSWNKLLLLAKSVPQIKKSEKILTSELQFQELRDAYDAHLEGRLSDLTSVGLSFEQLMNLQTEQQRKEPPPLLTLDDLYKALYDTESSPAV